MIFVEARIAALCVLALLAGKGADAQTQRLFPPGHDPACPTCYVQQVEIAAAPGAVPVAAAEASCQRRANLDFLSTVLRIVQPRVDGDVSGNLVEAAKTLPRAVLEGLREEVAADFRATLAQSRAVSPFATCLPLAVLLPDDAEPWQVVVGPLDRAGVFHACPEPPGTCGADLGRLLLAPTIVDRAARLAVATAFMTAPDQAAVLRMLVSFRLPAGEIARPLR